MVASHIGVTSNVVQPLIFLFMTVTFDSKRYVAKVSNITDLSVIQTVCTANNWRIVEQSKTTAVIAFKSALTAKVDFLHLESLVNTK